MFNLITASIILLAGHSMEQDRIPYEENNKKVADWVAKSTQQSEGGGQPVAIKDSALCAYVQGATFHSVHYPEFPIARRPPEPMVMRNVLMVDSKGGVMHFTSREGLRKAFLKLAQPIDSGAVSEFALGWLKASTVFSQDGFFQFVFADKNVHSEKHQGVLVVTATAPVVEKGGDTGSLVAVLSFAPTKTEGVYRLNSIVEKDTIKPGIRPICQSTLLLDKNPIVRKMAERDLLVMGESALPYMAEQYSKASPKLKKEIERVRQRILRGDR